MKTSFARSLVTAAFLASLIGAAHAAYPVVDASPGTGTLIYHWISQWWSGKA